MAEGTYEYECNRAELLGIDPPDREVFEAAARARQEEDARNQALLELSIQDEEINATSGKFNELNSILSVTQQRINKFKQACGSLTNLLKIRPNQETGLAKDQLDEPGTSAAASHSSDDTDTKKALEVARKSLNEKSSLEPQITSGFNKFDKLDAMINQAENAQYSMAKQTSDMKKLMK